MEQLFGTNGIRGIANEKLSASFASEIGMAIGTFAEGKRIVISTDGRTSNEMLKSAIVSGLLATGCEVVDIGIAPTPAVQFAVPELECRLGITVTASHNPPEFNGIKCAGCDGAELMREDEETIERIYYAKKFALAPWNKIGRLRKGSVMHTYIDRVCGFIDTKKTSETGLKVVLDCGNGATSLVTPYILKRLGCNVVTINAHIDGKFPGHPSEPTPENARQLIDAVRSLKADLGIIQDGDGDRTIFVDEKGNYVPGERSMAVIANFMTLGRRGGVVVTPINSSKCVEDVVTANSCRLEYTKVGSPSIIAKMKELGAVFGGEEAGGLVYPGFQYAKDGMMTAAKMVEILSITGKKMSELLSGIPEYHVHKARVSCPDEKKTAVLQLFRNEMESAGLKADMTDGLKLYFKGGWILVRPSGTEPIYRIYVETRNKKESERLAKDYIRRLEKIMSKCR